MAETFRRQDAIEIRKEAEAAVEELKKAAASFRKCRKEVERAADRLLLSEIHRELAKVPVEELNREKRGFRVKTLREYGYETIADLCTAEVWNIAAVNGISSDTAYTIKAVVNLMVAEARKNIRVGLSSDQKTEEATALLCAVSEYRKRKKESTLAEDLLTAYAGRIEAALSSLQKAGSGIRWLLRNRTEKEEAENAFSFLSDLFSGDFPENVRRITGVCGGITAATGEEAWAEFEKEPVPFINCIEEICPGILGSDDTRYGLPEDLWRELEEECVFPDGLKCELRNYQVLGVKYILHQGNVLLGDEMGLGKTVQAIAAMVSLRNTGATHFVVVCPAGVLSNWCREIRKMSELSVVKVHGEDRGKALSAWKRSGGVAVTTYETAWLFNTGEEYRFSLLVVDEAHYIKNPEAQRTAFVKKLCAHADRLLFMTGTALENRVSEMVSLIEILRPAIAGRIRKLQYLSQAEEFREIVAPVYYRRRREDVLTELPELIEEKEWCEMGQEETRVYNEAVLSGNYADVRRVSWNVPDLKDSCKAQRLLEIIDDAAEDGRKVIVFSFFLDTIRKIKELLRDVCLPPINGAVPPGKRQEIIDEFEKAPAGTVLCAQIQSGGTGLNIQAASVVILCEPQLKPSVENQAISRAYRMGQTRKVLCYRLLCEDTAEEEIVSMLGEKQAVFDAFADTSRAAEEIPEIDGTTWKEIIEHEIRRITEKGLTNSL